MCKSESCKGSENIIKVFYTRTTHTHQLLHSVLALHPRRAPELSLTLLSPPLQKPHLLSTALSGSCCRRKHPAGNMCPRGLQQPQLAFYPSRGCLLFEENKPLRAECSDQGRWGEKRNPTAPPIRPHG